MFQEAGSWRYAERLAVELILPLSKFYTAADIKRLLKIVQDNGQIYGAADMPESVTDLFKRTDRLHEEARPHWEKFLVKQRPTHYPFSPLAEAMTAAGMAVPEKVEDGE